MTDQTTPGQPTELYFTTSADLTTAYVYWTAATSSPAATGFLVQWGISGNDPLTTSNPGSWLGSATVTASPATITGLSPGTTYDVQVTPQTVSVTGTPAVLAVDMQAADTTQDTYFSIYVPATAGPSYMRVGAADQSTVESVLLSQWVDTNGTLYPASLDLGSNATTGAVIYSSSDVAILAQGDVRLRTTGGFYSAAGNLTSSTQGGVNQVVSPSGGLVSFANTYQDRTGNYFSVKYDSTYNLAFSDTTGGTFAIAALYDFYLGTKASTSLAATVETSFSAAAVSLGYSFLKVDVGFGSLSTNFMGEDYDFRATKDVTGGNVKLALTNEAAKTAFATALTGGATILTALSAVIAAFAAIITATEWGYLETADAKNPTPMNNFLTDTSVPFYTTLQVANAALLYAGVALGVGQIQLRRSTKVLDTTYIELDNDPEPTIEIVNGDAQLAFTSSSANLNVTGGGLVLLSALTAALKLGDPAAPTAALSLNATGATLSSLTTLNLTATTSITLACGASSIMLSDAGITISTPALTSLALQNLISAGSAPLLEEVQAIKEAADAADAAINTAQEIAIAARDAVQELEAAVDWAFSFTGE